jgi:general secretion pathway protein A
MPATQKDLAPLMHSFFERYGLRGDPFDGAPAIRRHPYLSASMRKALSELYYRLESGADLIVVLADRGIGKTTLLRHLEGHLRSRCGILFLSTSESDISQLLRDLLHQLDSNADDSDAPTMLVQIGHLLMQQPEFRPPFILFIDSTQSVNRAAFEVAEAMRASEACKRGRLKILIAESPELGHESASAELLNGILPVLLAPLSAIDIEHYIDHRLRAVGWKGKPVFTANACNLIGELSGGVPARINEICSNALQTWAIFDDLRVARAVEREDWIIDEHNVNFLSVAAKPPSPSATQFKKYRVGMVAALLLILVASTVGLWYYETVGGLRRIDLPVISTSVPIPLNHRTTGNTALIGAGNKVLVKAASEPSKLGKDTISGPRVPGAVSTDLDVSSETMSVTESTTRRRTILSTAAEKVASLNEPKTDSGAAIAGMRTSNETGGVQVTIGDAYIHLGDAYMNIGDYDKAIQNFLRARALAPDNEGVEQKIKRARQAKNAEKHILQ